MRKLIILLWAFLAFYMDVNADITFKFTPRSTGHLTTAMKSKMEKDISILLTEIDAAGRENRALDLSSLNMEPEAKSNLASFWRILPFVCEFTQNVSECLQDFQGYQVRKIKVLMKPKNNTYKQKLNRELTISLSKDGVITGVRPAAELNEDYTMIMNDAQDVTDLVQRREILKFVEDFRCYYNQQNIHALEKIFSDNALIITGSVITQRNTGDGKPMVTNVLYKKQNKKEYLTSLKRVFDRTSFINVTFDRISVKRHSAKKNIIGVTLHQKWESSSYCDDGWVFLLWDFNDPERPQIHVRTWQPDQVAQKDGIFNENDFFIP